MERSLYKKGISFLDSLVNYEKQRSKLKLASLKLWRLRRLLAILKIYPQNLKIIQIAGTKGKGSVAMFLSSILSAHHLKTGLFTSPHLEHWRERIGVVYDAKGSVRYSYISKSDISEFWHLYSQRILDFYHSAGGRGLSFFELLTAISFYYFQRKKVDLAVLEAGLGGELDATNVSKRNELAVITPIDYDHQEVLGHTISSIAYAKAGIIKKGSIVLTNQHRPLALRVIRTVSKKREAILYVQKRHFSPEAVEIKPSQSRFLFYFEDEQYGPFVLRQKGDYQVENATLALAAAKVFLSKQGRSFSFIKAKKSLKGLTIPGRWEIVKKRPLVILDIAHNELSLLRLLSNLRYYYQRSFILIFALAKDKKITKVRPWLKKAKTIILPQINHMRLLSPSELKEYLKLKKVVITSSLPAAVRQALNLISKDELLLITGSTYLVAEARNLLCRRNII